MPLPSRTLLSSFNWLLLNKELGNISKSSPGKGETQHVIPRNSLSAFLNAKENGRQLHCTKAGQAARPLSQAGFMWCIVVPYLSATPWEAPLPHILVMWAPCLILVHWVITFNFSMLPMPGELIWDLGRRFLGLYCHPWYKTATIPAFLLLPKTMGLDSLKVCLPASNLAGILVCFWDRIFPCQDTERLKQNTEECLLKAWRWSQLSVFK